MTHYYKIDTFGKSYKAYETPDYDYLMKIIPLGELKEELIDLNCSAKLGIDYGRYGKNMMMKCIWESLKPQIQEITPIFDSSKFYVTVHSYSGPLYVTTSHIPILKKVHLYEDTDVKVIRYKERTYILFATKKDIRSTLWHTTTK